MDPSTSSIIVVSDTMLGIEETPNAKRRMSNFGATVVRGVLFRPRDMGDGDMTQSSPIGIVYQAALLDICGRKVMALRPGANDVSRLAPGVYFVRSGPSAVTKVVVTR